MKKYVEVHSKFHDFRFNLESIDYFKEFVKFFNKYDINVIDNRKQVITDFMTRLSAYPKCKVLYHSLNEMLVILEVNSYEAMTKVGTQSWCITTSERSWNEYVNNNKQIIVWNFNLIDRHPMHMIGITFNLKKREIIWAFDQDDHELKTGKMFKYVERAYTKSYGKKSKNKKRKKSLVSL
jgi:hypothetical protein